MKLVIEQSDQTKVGIPPGEYDLDDLGAVQAVRVTGSQPGAHHGIEIELLMHSGMTPEPGSIGEPHFKFGVDVKDDLQYRRQKVTIFGRPLQGQAFGYKVTVADSLLHTAKDPESEARKVIERGVRSVADEIVAALVERAVEQVISPVAKTTGTKTGRTRSQRRVAQDAFFGLPSSKPKDKCDECGGSGVWKNPANGAESDCSRGCPKP